MTSILKLRQQKQEALDQADALHKSLLRSGREMTQAEAAKFQTYLVEAKTLGLEIATHEAEMERDRTGPAALTYDSEGRLTPARNSVGRGSAGAQAYGLIGAKYSELFGAPKASAFKSSDEFLQTVASGRYDPRLYADAGAYSGTNETVPAEGGFAVPDEFAREFLDNSLLEDEIVRPRARTVPMLSDRKIVPMWDAEDNSTAAPYGGLKLLWASEQALLATEMPKMRQIQLTAFKAYLFSWVSSELMEDGVSFSDALSKAFQKSLGWGLDLAFFSGAGAGTPLGVLNDPALIVVPKLAAQTPFTINYTNLTQLFSRCHPGALKNAIWVASSSSLPQLLSLVIPGTTVPVVVQNTVTGELRILSLPIVFTEKLPALGSQGDIILADWSQYLIGMRREASIATSNAPGFMQDLIAMRAIVRITGQGTWARPFTPLNGPTTSWAVTLASRTS